MPLSHERPALERLDPKVFIRTERIVAECFTRLRPPLVQVAVQPQSKTATVKIQKEDDKETRVRLSP